ncbi:hypothetical protein FB466_0864 [Klugiella xanthotipulae]|uniref:Uncharacterized protein n=1 Tax=Klugiella xanthotipulae TaxID=244735 RepID=A0A543I616_9MICO|nr:hypothetical protein FB466_0864 [Klugiella xanthotipulae]
MSVHTRTPSMTVRRQIYVRLKPGAPSALGS